jgi:predicted dehydrogenase
MDGPEAATQLYGTQGFGQLFPTHLKLVDANTKKVEVVKSGFKFPRKEHCPQTMYDAQMAYFLNCVRNRTTPVPGGLEGLTNMKIVDAAYKSSKTGKVVEIKN